MNVDKLFQAVQRSVSLEQVIREEILADGLMTFARFMELALYHDPLGYYRATPDATTRSGDFLTSPDTHPAFGRLLARFGAALALEMQAGDFTVVEQGAGTGALAESFIRGWREEAPDVPMRYAMVAPYAGSRKTLSERLGNAANVVGAIGDLAPFSGLYMSNELPDAYPVHRVRNRGGELREVFVDVRDDALAEAEGDPSTPALAEYLEDAGIVLRDGDEIEVNLGLEPWLKEVAAAMEKGRMLTIDYGYEAADVQRFSRGTLLAHYRHATNEDFLQRIGMQDLTAHVCWTAVERIGSRAGLHLVERTTQREFLTRWGWKELGREMMARPGITHTDLDAFDRLGRIGDGLGGLGVVVTARGEWLIR